MSNVKPGDRAVVIKSSNPVNLGKIVEVGREIHEGERIEGPFVFLPSLSPFHARPPYWLCETLGGPFKLKSICGHLDPTSLAPIPDAWLKRLDPPEDEQLGQDEGLGAPVKDSETVEVQS